MTAGDRIPAGSSRVTAGAPALRALAVDAAEAAGCVLLERYGRSGPVGTKTTATDPVTEADRASEALLVERILAARPDDGLLGEEGAVRRGLTGLRWVVDPLDGTVNYLYGLPAWCVSVACEDDAGALAGAVHDPLRGETFSAARGGGATLDGRPLRVNDPVALPEALVATGFAYARDVRARQAAVVARLLPLARDVRRGGSAALDLCAVAAGRVDGYYEDATAHWDWAAGALIAGEAGAVVEPYGDGKIAAGPGLLPQLRDALAGS